MGELPSLLVAYTATEEYGSPFPYVCKADFTAAPGVPEHQFCVISLLALESAAEDTGRTLAGWTTMLLRYEPCHPLQAKKGAGQVMKKGSLGRVGIAVHILA